MTVLNRDKVDWTEDWDRDELMVACQVLGLKSGDAYYMMETLPEKTAEYLVEVMMQRDMIGPTMVMYMDPDEDMEDDYYHNGGYPVYGYCRSLSNDMNLIALYKHDLLVLAHELTHAVLHHKDRANAENPHDEVFWATHMMVNEFLMMLMGR